MKHITDNDMIAYMNGELSDNMNKKIEQHLHECEECSQLAFFMEELTNEWNEPSIQPQADIVGAVMSTIEEKQHTPKKVVAKKRKKLVYFHFAVAAAATILFSQLQVVERIFDTSNEVIGFSSQISTQANQSLERGLQFFEIISNKINIGDEIK